MFGWWSAAAASASARSMPGSTPRRARTTFTATSRPSSRSRASKTTPKPPRPSSRSTSKRPPITVPGPMPVPGRTSGASASSSRSADIDPGFGRSAADPGGGFLGRQATRWYGFLLAIRAPRYVEASPPDPHRSRTDGGPDEFRCRRVPVGSGKNVTARRDRRPRRTASAPAMTRSATTTATSFRPSQRQSERRSRSRIADEPDAGPASCLSPFPGRRGGAAGSICDSPGDRPGNQSTLVCGLHRRSRKSRSPRPTKAGHPEQGEAAVADDAGDGRLQVELRVARKRSTLSFTWSSATTTPVSAPPATRPVAMSEPPPSSESSACPPLRFVATSRPAPSPRRPRRWAGWWRAAGRGRPRRRAAFTPHSSMVMEKKTPTST